MTSFNTALSRGDMGVVRKRTAHGGGKGETKRYHGGKERGRDRAAQSSGRSRERTLAFTGKFE
jgi:hypothetical protein